MNIEQIEKLIELVEQSSLTEFSYKDGEVKLTMSKLEYPPVAGPMPPMPPMGPMGAMPQAAPMPVKEEEKDEEVQFITSPIVGTFYSAPAPDAPAYVKVGDRVKNGQTVCILEAMKLMNEITAEKDGTITEICAVNGQTVEYGTVLFKIK